MDPTKFATLHAVLTGIEAAAEAGSLETCEQLAHAALCVLMDLPVAEARAQQRCDQES